jgi:N-methylhydantoinase A
MVRYGHSTRGAPVDLVAVRLAASGVNEWPMAAGAPEDVEGAAARRRTVVFDAAPTDAAVVHRREIVDGTVLHGPAIVEEPTATTVVPPGWRVVLGPANALVISRTEATDR